MARPGLLRHRKFVRLARLLGSDALAVGHLEIIWQAAYEAGDANVGTAGDLECLARWHGESGALTRFLLEAGFIDNVNDTEFAVHDLIDHAPDYVVRRMKRADERRRKGTTISELRAQAANVRHSGKRRTAAAGGTPAPALRSDPSDPTGEPGGEDWGRETLEIHQALPPGGKDRKFLARIGWLLAAGAPIRAQVRDAIAGAKVKRPENPVGYFRVALRSLIGAQVLRAMLAQAPTEMACADPAAGNGAVPVPQLRSADDDA